VPKTAFDPQLHGFAFANSFRLAPDERGKLIAALATAIDGALGTLGPLGLAARILGVRDKLARLLVSAVPDNYGLCGGMAFAALDYFRAGRPVPRGTGPNDQPSVGSTLRLYLWQRLLESWASNGVTFLEWIARLHLLPARWPFDAGPRALRDRSRDAWRTLKRSIDAGDPVPIGLVGEATDPFLDHQVLAYGYDPKTDLSGTIYVYDMNCPGAGQTIEIDLSTDVLSATESCPRAGNALRGFFCESYAAGTPPAIA
jgi:hypothetical protein